METYCDLCRTSFTLHGLSVEVEGELHETYFTCPNCDHRFVCFVTDSTVRMMQSRIDSLTGKQKEQFQSDINQRMRTLKFQRITLHEFRRLKDEAGRR